MLLWLSLFAIGAKEYLREIDDHLGLNANFDEKPNAMDISEAIDEAMLFGEELLENYVTNSRDLTSRLKEPFDAQGIKAVVE